MFINIRRYIRVIFFYKYFCLNYLIINMKNILLTLILFLFWFCAKPEKQNDKAAKSSLLLPVKIINTERNVIIPLKGIPEPLNSATITMPDSSVLISLLVEKGDNVTVGDLLGSLWFIRKKNREYTPKDLRAPLSGTITELNYQLDSPISPYSVIMKIEDLRQLKIKVKINRKQLNIIKPYAKAVFTINREEMEGYIRNIDPITLQMEIIIPDKNMEYIKGESISGYVDCGKLNGSFMADRYFQGKDSLYVKIEEDIMIYIYKTAISDTLALIYPSLFDKKEIFLYRENLTSVKNILY